MAHVDNIALTCVDFRLQDVFNEWVKKNIGEADVISLAGASGSVLDPIERPCVDSQIKKLQKLHYVKTVYIVDHEDCGAYGGSAKFDGDQAVEIAMHKEKLGEAQEELQKAFPDLRIEIRMAGFDGSTLI